MHDLSTISNHNTLQSRCRPGRPGVGPKQSRAQGNAPSGHKQVLALTPSLSIPCSFPLFLSSSPHSLSLCSTLSIPLSLLRSPLFLIHSLSLSLSPSLSIIHSSPLYPSSPHLHSIYCSSFLSLSPSLSLSPPLSLHLTHTPSPSLSPLCLSTQGIFLSFLFQSFSPHSDPRLSLTVVLHSFTLSLFSLSPSLPLFSFLSSGTAVTFPPSPAETKHLLTDRGDG